MIQEIIDGICLAVDEEFNGLEQSYEIHTESLEQGFDGPCFFVLCIGQESEAQLAQRYRRAHSFGIHYFPDSEEPRAECLKVAERLFGCLELIRAGDSLIRGTDMESRIEEKVLIFTVDFNVFLCKPGQQVEMENVTVDTEVEG
ncbi:MAG: hypothetical protein KH452_05935 [Clostridiales bacterium]|nr:hypothetical protein [Clostridiales bacterium]